MGAKDIVIRAQSVWKSFPLKASSIFGLWLGRAKNVPTFAALKGVSLIVERGEMLGVLGANGAGKSTLLRLLAGIYSPDKGSITIGSDLAGLFELGGLSNAHMTGREYVYRYLQLYQVPYEQHASIMEEVREFSELDSYFEEKIRMYSSGMAARLYFSTVTALQHSIYLIDEILSVGDEHFQTKSWARMRERLSAGASGLLVTHDWSAVIKLCRQACVLYHGEKAPEGNADKVVADYLKLPLPAPTKAEILAPAQFHIEADMPLLLEFEVRLKEAVAAEVAVSIEYLMLGVGWEIVVMTEFALVGNAPGLYRVRIEAPYVPLKPGEYILNIFLGATPDAATGTRRSLHVFSWTYGNGLKLTVSGAAREDLAPFPVTWKQAA